MKEEKSMFEKVSNICFCIAMPCITIAAIGLAAFIIYLGYCFITGHPLPSK